MVGDHLFSSARSQERDFRWRGDAPSRTEALSDGVFAITISLLVISSEVPRTFYELWQVVQGLPVFLLSFAVLLTAWRAHFLFFRRFGLDDGLTQALNGLFLFLVVFCAFPLKFMASFLWAVILGADTEALFSLPAGVVWSDTGPSQRASLVLFLCGGVAGLFGSLALLFLRAWSMRVALSLSSLERAQTLFSLARLLLPVFAALVAALILARGMQPGIAGVAFLMVLPAWLVLRILSHQWLSRLRLAESKGAD